MNRSVLIINQTFWPDCVATAQQSTDLAVELVGSGFSVTAIADCRSYDDRTMILPKSEMYRGFLVLRVNSTALGKKTKFHRGIDYISFNIALVLRLLALPRYDFVIGLTTPPWISFFGVLFCNIKGGRFVHWAMDVNPEETVKLGWVREYSLFYKLMNAWAKFTYRKSHEIIALDHYMAQSIHTKGVCKQKIHVIPPWSHDEITSVKHEVNPFRRRYSLDGKFAVMYSGNFSACHPLDTLLEAARVLRANKDIVFFFIGDGVRLSEILAFKDKHYLDNIIYLPYQKREELKYSLSAADLHIVSMGNEFVGIVHPCKIYGILRTGRPFVLIGPRRSHIGDIMTENKIGYQVDHGDVDGLVSIIEEVRSLSGIKLQEISNKSQLLAKTRFSRNILSRRIITQCIDSDH